MDRRDLLAALAAGAVAVPGCLGDSDGAGEGSLSATPTETPTVTEPTATGGARPSPADSGSGTETTTAGGFVDEAFVVPELAAPDSPDSFGVYGERDEQYVVALLDARGGTDPPVEEIELVAGGDSYAARVDVGRQWWALFDYGEPYSPVDEPEGWVVFRVPNPLDADAATITWPGGERALTGEAVAALARPPASFAVRSFAAPETADPGEPIELSVTVENTASVDGTFVAALNRSAPLYAPEATARLPVPAGETATWEHEHTVSERGPSQPHTLRFGLYWRDGSMDRTVRVGATATTEGDPATTERGDPPTAAGETDRSTPSETPTATETRPITPTPSPE
ncbi:hypothetical protein [Halosimplex halophilum]|uniref:hypothetical protein n=1 Tax=Halosimplex halophilum TaxID=2559572 RepID=UPI00107FA45E|nr:hypothetical protein [Halosimplex halophilum]